MKYANKSTNFVRTRIKLREKNEEDDGVNPRITAGKERRKCMFLLQKEEILHFYS